MPTQSVSLSTVIYAEDDGTYRVEVPSIGIQFEGYTKDMGDKGWVVAPFVPLYATIQDGSVTPSATAGSMSVDYVSFGSSKKNGPLRFPVSSTFDWVLSNAPHFQVSLYTKPFASAGQIGLVTLSDGRGQNLRKEFRIFSRVGLAIPHSQGSLSRSELQKWLYYETLAVIDGAATEAGGGTDPDYKLLSVEQAPNSSESPDSECRTFSFQLVEGSKGSGKQGWSGVKTTLINVFRSSKSSK